MTDTVADTRVSFQLTYARSPVERTFQPGLLTGPSIPCAYGSDVSASGDWEDGDDLVGFDQPETEDEWVDRYARYAINEAVHEALEWFRVDGEPWLDPHGLQENAIHNRVNALCAELAELRKQSAA